MIVVNANSEIFQLYHGENKLHILRQGRRDTLIKIDILKNKSIFEHE
jgi:hypothetical protein